MSRIKTNPSTIKDCIIAIKNSELSDSKKNTIMQVLKQYQQDKQKGIYTDGMIMERLKCCYMEENVEMIKIVLKDIIDNISKRKYF